MKGNVVTKLSIIPIQPSASFLSVSASTGNVTGGNFLGDYLDSKTVKPISQAAAGWTKTQMKAGYLGSLGAKLANYLDRDRVKPKLQFSGAFGVIDDRDTVNAKLGYADQSPS